MLLTKILRTENAELKVYNFKKIGLLFILAMSFIFITSIVCPAKQHTKTTCP